MPKIKVPRKNISLDMTAMCDVAFLLLTFFMLTTKFKPQEAVVVDIPSSVSEIKLEQRDVMIISVDKKGAVYFGIDGQNEKLDLIDRISRVYNIQFSEEEKKEFSLMTSFGTPVANLKQVLNMPQDKRDKLQAGIPLDSLNNELRDWVSQTRLVFKDRNVKIAVKGDKDVDYDVISRVIETLQAQNINKFNLITNLEIKP